MFQVEFGMQGVSGVNSRNGRPHRARRQLRFTLEGKPFTMDQDLETICGDLLTQHLISRDVTRLLKRTVPFVIPGKKGVMSYKGKMTDTQQAEMVVKTAQKYPGAQILNAMPFADAVAVFRANG